MDRTSYKFIAREPYRIDGVWVMADFWSGYFSVPGTNWGDYHHTRISQLWMEMWQ